MGPFLMVELMYTLQAWSMNSEASHDHGSLLLTLPALAGAVVLMCHPSDKRHPPFWATCHL